jgi:tripartite ATP-independent transporter DctM subunit
MEKTGGGRSMIVSFTFFLILLFTGLPIYVNLGFCSFLFMFLEGYNPITVVQRITMTANSFTLLAAPFFILMGNIMNNSGVTTRMFNFASVLVGNRVGGLGHANVLASVMFAGGSGTAVADAGGLGTIEIKAMRDAGYDDDFTCAVSSASTVIVPITPPSLPMVILAVTVEASIGRLFLAGIIPGLLVAAALMVMVSIYAHRRNYPRGPKPTVKAVWVSFKEAFWALLTPFILFAGIFSGVFTPTEAAAAAAFYALVLGLFIYKELKIKDLPKVFLATCETTGVVLALVMAANIFGYVLSVSQVPQSITQVLLTLSDNKILLLIIINLFLLFVGMFMEALALILILAPILVPVMVGAGLHETHACMIIILNLMIGVVTPPVGVVLFVISNIAKLPFERVTKATAPFLIPLIFVLILVTYIPGITTFLPSLVFGK